MAPEPQYHLQREWVYQDAPPSYEDVEHRYYGHGDKVPHVYNQSRNRIATLPSRDNLHVPIEQQSQLSRHVSSRPSTSSNPNLPIVIPQTTKAFGGAFASPFVRAYAPSLATFSCPQSQDSTRHAGPIDATTFLAFLDGLNEAFIGSPAWKALNAVGMGMSFAPLLSVSAAGSGLSLASGFGSAATSYFRTVTYVKTANETLFHPAGLKVAIKSTKDMMAAVGVDGDMLQLPPLDDAPVHISDAEYSQHLSNETSPDDPRMRRLRALDGRVAQLTFDVPAPVAQSNWLKKMGDWEAQRTCKKQNEKIMEQRSKAAGTEKVSKADQEVTKVQQEMDKVDAKARRETEKHGHRHHGREADKIEKDRQREMRKLEHEMDKALRKLDRKTEKSKGKGKDVNHQDKAERKEQKAAQKIRWVVITKLDECEQDSHDDEEDVADYE